MFTWFKNLFRRKPKVVLTPAKQAMQAHKEVVDRAINYGPAVAPRRPVTPFVTKRPPEPERNYHGVQSQGPDMGFTNALLMANLMHSSNPQAASYQPLPQIHSAMGGDFSGAGASASWDSGASRSSDACSSSSYSSSDSSSSYSSDSSSSSSSSDSGSSCSSSD